MEKQYIISVDGVLTRFAAVDDTNTEKHIRPEENEMLETMDKLIKRMGAMAPDELEAFLDEGAKRAEHVVVQCAHDPLPGKCAIFRDDLVLYAGKLWRVDWLEGSTLGISNNAGEHKEVGEGAVRPLSSWFKDRPVEEILP